MEFSRNLEIFTTYDRKYLDCANDAVRLFEEGNNITEIVRTQKNNLGSTTYNDERFLYALEMFLIERA